jgi:hypothetical protein
MPFRFVGAVAWRAGDVEKNAACGRRSREAVDGRAAASIDSWAKLRRHIEGGILAMEAHKPLNGGLDALHCEACDAAKNTEVRTIDTAELLAAK